MDTFPLFMFLSICAICVTVYHCFVKILENPVEDDD
jgi:hypothetical protein